MAQERDTTADEKRVRIGFDPDTQEFTIVPETVRLERRGRILILKDPPNDPRWNLLDADVEDEHGQFTIESKSDVQIVLDDRCTTNGTFCYTVTVEDGQNGPIVSPDPHIRNENP